MAHASGWPATPDRVSITCFRQGLRRCWHENAECRIQDAESPEAHFHTSVHLVTLSSCHLVIKGGPPMSRADLTDERRFATWPFNWALIRHTPGIYAVHSVFHMLFLAAPVALGLIEKSVFDTITGTA